MPKILNTKFKGQNLPAYDPDLDGDNDAEEAAGLISAAQILLNEAYECLTSTVSDDDVMNLNNRNKVSASAKNVVLPFKPPTSKSVLRISSAAQTSEYNMDLFGVVGGDFWGDGGITKEQFAQTLNKIPNNCKTVNLRMSSPGGDVFEGRAIFNMMKDSPLSFDVNIIAEASSIASIIAMAGNTIHMGDGAVMLVHRCYAFTIGNSLELTKLAADLNTIDNTMVQTYAKKTGMKSDAILSLMDENRYMSPEEAKSRGFVDSISNIDDNVSDNSILKIAAFDIDRKRFHLPPLPKDSRPGLKSAMAALNRIKQARV